MELKWTCPGKRAPSPARKEEIKSIETPEQKAKMAKEMEFDFMDDLPVPTIRHRQQTPKSVMKKKTNFDGVINQMRKHGRLSATNPGQNNANTSGTGPPASSSS